MGAGGSERGWPSGVKEAVRRPTHGSGRRLPNGADKAYLSASLAQPRDAGIWNKDPATPVSRWRSNQWRRRSFRVIRLRAAPCKVRLSLPLVSLSDPNPTRAPWQL
jgi:hypothetical protein